VPARPGARAPRMLRPSPGMGRRVPEWDPGRAGGAGFPGEQAPSAPARRLLPACGPCPRPAPPRLCPWTCGGASAPRPRTRDGARRARCSTARWPRIWRRSGPSANARSFGRLRMSGAAAEAARAGVRGVHVLRGAFGRFRARQVRPLRDAGTGGVLLQAARHLSVLRGKARGGGRSLARGPRAAGSSHPPVGDFASVPSASAAGPRPSAGSG